MQFGINWLGDYLAEVPNTDLLKRELPLAGFEVEKCQPTASWFTGVVVAEVIATQQHPNADRLRLCKVYDGQQEYSIVCGAPNARVGIKVALSRVGAVLPSNFKIKRSKIRGEVSEGMLCSESELNISQEQDGIIELPSEALLGEDVRSVLALDEQIIDLDVTPNRGDCLSIRGLAREIATIAKIKFTDRSFDSINSTLDGGKKIHLEAGDACPRYVGRLIRLGAKGLTSPLWMKQRLVRAGLRPISLIVDITNLVMLDLGQPIHAFDYNKLTGDIRVKWAKGAQSLELLNGQRIDLNDSTLVIADDSGPIALAGIMGGKSTETDAHSDYIFLEAAHFSTNAIAGRARNFGLHTDASMRFERGVDWQLPQVAIEMASCLLIEYASAQVAPLHDTYVASFLPKKKTIDCKMTDFNRLAGTQLDTNLSHSHLHSLGMKIDSDDDSDSFTVTTPTWRYDMDRPEDVFEEVLRLHGYSQIPEILPQLTRPTDFGSDTRINSYRLFDHLVGMGYQEVISYSFIEIKAQMEFIEDEQQSIALKNPISPQFAHMRSSLIPSLLGVIKHNLRRNHKNISIFETGLNFRANKNNNHIEQKPVLAMALCGNYSDHWQDQGKQIDFYYLKGHIESLLALTHDVQQIRFVTTQIKGFHPGQSVKIIVGEDEIGVFGKVHPKTAKTIDLADLDLYVAEINLSALSNYQRPIYQKVSVYPAIYRDLAVVVDKSVQWQQIHDCIQSVADDRLIEIVPFDLYQHENIGKNNKSIAFRIRWQSTTETLTDSCINDQIDAILIALESQLQAKLRDQE